MTPDQISTICKAIQNAANTIALSLDGVAAALNEWVNSDEEEVEEEDLQDEAEASEEDE